MSDDPVHNGNPDDESIPLFVVKADQIEIGIAHDVPGMGIVHFHAEDGKIFAMAFNAEAIAKVYLGFETVIKMLSHFNIEDPDIEGETYKLPKEKLN